MIASSALPFWVEPSPTEPGSIDPLGYLAQSDRIAEQLLPGVTVQTSRARYLSFLCWAIQKTGDDPNAIDRWEVALSVGEHRRHGNGEAELCKFFGSRLLKQRQLEDKDPLPKRLHVQTARLLYSGLLRSCGLYDGPAVLSELGKKLAEDFGRHMPRSLPSKVGRCDVMPCLSNISMREEKYLCDGLLQANADAERRAYSFSEIGRRAWKGVRNEGAAWLLAQYIKSPGRNASAPAVYLHEGAKLELQALPLTRLFLLLYQSRGKIRGQLRPGSFRAFQIGASTEHLLADLAAHLRRAQALGEETPPLTLAGLKRWVLTRHRQEAKPEAPWVDENWHVLRPGLQPQHPPGIHGYRLEAFSSLMADLRKI